MLTIALLSLGASTGVIAQPTAFVVAPAPLGDDAHDCSSASSACATFQRATDLCPVANHCTILALPGTYSQRTAVTHYRFISIFGPIQNAICPDRTEVQIDDRVNGVGEKGLIFDVEDHATLAVSCATVSAYALGSIGFAARQFAIADVDDIDFGSFAGGQGVAASESSKINVYSPGIHGDANRFAMAFGLSQIDIGGDVSLSEGLTFDVALIAAVDGSIVSFHPSTMTKFRGGGRNAGRLLSMLQCNY